MTTWSDDVSISFPDKKSTLSPPRQADPGTLNRNRLLDRIQEMSHYIKKIFWNLSDLLFSCPPRWVLQFVRIGSKKSQHLRSIRSHFQTQLLFGGFCFPIIFTLRTTFHANRYVFDLKFEILVTSEKFYYLGEAHFRFAVIWNVLDLAGVNEIVQAKCLIDYLQMQFPGLFLGATNYKMRNHMCNGRFNVFFSGIEFTFKSCGVLR